MPKQQLLNVLVQVCQPLVLLIVWKVQALVSSRRDYVELGIEDIDALQISNIAYDN